jgi:hypothetical protein
MESDQAKRLRELEVQNQRLRERLAKAALDKRILKTALEGNYRARHGGVTQSITFKRLVKSRSVRHVEQSGMSNIGSIIEYAAIPPSSEGR